MNRGWYFASGVQKNWDVNMSSAISAARIGKEKRDAARQSGESIKHSYKVKRFQPKIVGGIKKNPVVPGSVLEEDMLFECKKFISFMLTQECVSPNKNSYITNCDCRSTILEANITSGAQAMIQFFTLSPYGRDVKCQDWVRRNWIFKVHQHFKKIGRNRK